MNADALDDDHPLADQATSSISAKDRFDDQHIAGRIAQHLHGDTALDFPGDDASDHGWRLQLDRRLCDAPPSVEPPQVVPLDEFVNLDWIGRNLANSTLQCIHLLS